MSTTSRAVLGMLSPLPSRARASMVAEGVDQLALAHLRAALDADLLGALLEVVLAPVLVGAGLAALLAGLLPVAVGDPRRLLLARALVAQRLVLLLVLDARAGILTWHRQPPGSFPRAYPAIRRRIAGPRGRGPLRPRS